MGSGPIESEAMRIVKYFAAGFVATLTFHQAAVALLNATGLVSRRAYPMAAVPPFGVPQVLSLAFWGGVWGIILGLYLQKVSKKKQWSAAVVFGALFPTLVAWFLVAPLKGLPLAGGWDFRAMLAAVVVNAVWGFGTAALIRAFK